MITKKEMKDAELAPRYICITSIVKHLPTKKVYSFAAQNSGDYCGKPVFNGEVFEKEITTTEWVLKNLI